MSRTGVLLATRRYWPLPGGWEKVWARLLDELARRGRKATVLTPNWQVDWPVETMHGNVRIVRVPPPERGLWSESRYGKRLVQAALKLRSEFGVMFVAGLRGDAYAAVGAARRGKFPVVLVPERPGLNGDCYWQLDATCGRRIKRRCFKADAFLGATPLLERELIAAGYARSRIRLLRFGVPFPEPTTPVGRRDARRALAQADPALALGEHEPLVVCVGRLRLGKGLDVLLQAWKAALPRLPPATLWLVGEGPDAAHLRDRLGELELGSRVRLTGAFDDVDDVYRAADAAVFPALEDGPTVGLLEAASHGLPIGASDVVTHRDRLTDQVEALVYPRHDVEALAATLVRLIVDRATAERCGAAARRRIAEQFTLARMADDYERLIDELAAARV